MAGGEKRSRATAEKKGDERSFEGLVKRLEEIVESLEAGDIPLEKSLALFEEGVTLAREGHRRLEGAERRISALMEDGTEKPMEPADAGVEAEADDEKDDDA